MRWPIVIRIGIRPRLTAQERVDRVRNLLAFFLVGSFVGALVAFSIRPVPPSNKDIITYMVGQLSGMALMALGLYFAKSAGQDAADAEKTANTGKMADAIKAAAQAGTVQPDVTLQPGETAQAAPERGTTD